MNEKLCGKAARWHHRRTNNPKDRRSCPKSKIRRSITILCQARTVLVVVEKIQNSLLVAGMLPGIQRLPLKKLDPDPDALFGMIMRWRSEAEDAGMPIDWVALAFEAGRDGFWLAGWLQTRGIDTPSQGLSKFLLTESLNQTDITHINNRGKRNHVRDPEAGAPSMDIELYRATINRIRDSGCFVPHSRGHAARDHGPPL